MTDIDFSALGRHDFQPMERRRHPTLITVGLLFALSLAMFGNVLFAGGTRVLGYQGSDLFLQFYSWRDFGFRELAHGNLAFWNPHVFGGAPYFGTMQGALLYPPNWIFLVLPLPAAVNWTVALHVFAIGAFMFCWMRKRGLGHVAGFFSGALVMFCGAFFPHIFAGHLPHLSTMVWSPLIFCAIDALFDTKAIRWCLVGSFAVAMQILAGFPQFLFYTAIIAGLYSALRLTSDWHWRITVALLCIYPVGIALAAVQVLPAVQATSETIRGVPLPFSFASMLAFPPENLVTLLAPNFFGEIVSYWGRSYLWETSLFIGVTGFALTVYGAIYCNRRTTWVPLAMIFVSLLLALGVHTPLFRWLYDWVPGFDKFRSISKFIFLASLFLALLAATGLDRLFRKKKIERAFVIAIFVAAILLGAAGWWTSTTSSWSDLMNTRRAMGETFLLPVFYGSADFVSQSQHRATMSIFLESGALVLLGGLLVLARVRPGALFGVVVIGVIEMVHFANGSLATLDSTLVVDSDQKRFLDQHPGDYRIINPVNPNSALSIGAQDIWGYDASVVRRYAEFITWTQGKEPNDATQYVKLDRLDPLYTMLRLRYVFGQSGNGLEVADAPYPPMPHLQLLSSYRVVSGRDAIFDALRSPTFDPRREVILESEPEPGPSPGGSSGKAEIVASSTDALTIEADVAQPTMLLITDTYTPSWRAVSLPGSAQANYQLLAANYILRAVPLAAGHHRLRVEYASTAFETGKWISIVAGAAFVAVSILCWKNRIPG